MNKCPVCKSPTSDDYYFIKVDGVDFKNLMLELEREILLEALERTRGNMKAASRLLKMKYYQMLHLVEKHGLKP